MSNSPRIRPDSTGVDANRRPDPSTTSSAGADTHRTLNSIVRYPVVDVTVDAADAELAADELLELGSTGIEERWSEAGEHVVLRAGFASDELAEAAYRALVNHRNASLEHLVGQDWMDTWRETFEPLREGRIVVVPAWVEPETYREHPVVLSIGDEDITIRLEPGRSFGTGAHSSTRLCLRVLQNYAHELLGARTVDAGCGSGILSVAMLLLGSSAVHAFDIETASLETTMLNAKSHGLADRLFVTHSLPRFSIDERPTVVVANILAPVLVTLAEAFVAASQPGALVILAGLIESQVDAVRAAYRDCTLLAVECGDAEDGAWRALALRAPSGD